jgi:RHS repeat-associated protein
MDDFTSMHSLNRLMTTNGTELIFGIDGNTNRLTETQSNVYGTYDNAGRLVSALNGAGGSFVYDDLDMVKKTTLTKVHVYTASDERILSIATGNNAEEWTLRDPSNRVLRRLQRIGAQWTWKEDDIYAAGQLIAAEVDTPAQTLHFFGDHLATPRLITANGGTKVAFHTYYPFGAEATSLSQDSEKLKFTGHERDAASLDYMHARYYAPLWGRFLSVDPAMDLEKIVHEPQLWNRYAYVGNNPVRDMNPDGRERLPCAEFAQTGHCADTPWRGWKTESLEMAKRGLFVATMLGIPLPGEGLLGRAFGAVGRFLGFGERAAVRAAAIEVPILTGSTREMFGEAMATIVKSTAGGAEKAAAFEQMATQITTASRGAWIAVRETAVDGSHLFIGSQGHAIVINAEGQVFRTQLGKGIVAEGKNLKVVWDVVKEGLVK